MSGDQPAVDSKTDRTASMIESKHSMGEDSAAMTIEFLRARLSSERTISRSARQQIEELTKKVIELERNLQAEMERRRLRQIAAEEALTKLEGAGVCLDSPQLDAFVRVFDLGKESLGYLDMNTANSTYLESGDSMNTRPHRSICDFRAFEIPKLNDQSNHSDANEADQNIEEPNLNSVNVELEKDEDANEADQNSMEPKLSPVKLEVEKDKDGEKDDRSLLRESRNLPSVPVRGIGRSCRTFKKKHASLDSDVPLVESWNDLSKDVTCLSQNHDQEEPEGSDLSRWINRVVDMLDHNSKQNFSSSSEFGSNDPAQPAARNINLNIQEYPSEKDECSPNPNYKEEFNNSDDASSTQLSYSCQNARHRELGDEVKKLLEHRAEFIAWNESQENAQMLWEQQHPLQITSEQEQAINDQMFHTENSIRQNKKQESSEEPLWVSEGIEETQCTEACIKNNLAKQFESNSSEDQKVTAIVPSEEQNLVHFMDLTKSHCKAPIDTSASDINNRKSVDLATLDLNQPTTSDTQSKSPHLGHEHTPSGNSMQAEFDEDRNILTSTMNEYCPNHAAISKGKETQGESADLLPKVSPKHVYSQDYCNNSECFSSGVDSKGGVNEERLVGNLRGDDPWDGVPIKADLQRQALHGKDVSKSPVLGNSEEFSQHSTSDLDDKGKHPRKLTRPYDPYKNVSNSRQDEHENATGANNKRSDETLLLKDQLHARIHSLSHPCSHRNHANIFGPLHEESMENPNSYFSSMSKQDHFQAHNISQNSSKFESSINVPDEKLQNVLKALRLAKEHLKESTKQRQLLSECANANKEPFYRDYSNFDYNHPLGRRDMKPDPPLEYSEMTQTQRDMKFSDFGLQNYTPSFTSALNDGYKYYPSFNGAHYMPLQGPFSQGPINSYVDKLNVGKGIEFFFKN